jgi:hypothetical protein
MATKPVAEKLYNSYDLEKWLQEQYGIDINFVWLVREAVEGNKTTILEVNKEYRDYFPAESWSALAILMSDFGEFVVEAV